MRCQTCRYKFVLNEGDCGACPRHCLKCTESKNGLTCTQCQNKTVMMSDGTCERKCDGRLQFRQETVAKNKLRKRRTDFTQSLHYQNLTN